MSPLVIEWAGEQWGLLAEKALHWPARKTVIVADVHFGKAAAFRHHGVPVPAGATHRDLARLSAIIHTTRCERLIVLGDLLHAKAGRAETTMCMVAEWRAAHASLHITLVRGNHDRAAGDPPAEWRIDCADQPQTLDHFQLRHSAPDRAAAFTIAGHVHPCVRLSDVDGSSMRAPCFVFSPHTALLPAFGSFTGMHVIRPREGDRVFAVGATEVIEVEVVCA